MIPPYRVMAKVVLQEWKMKPRASEDLVFCHNDFSTHNVVVNPATLKVMAVLDWECFGFYVVRPGSISLSLSQSTKLALIAFCC